MTDLILPEISIPQEYSYTLRAAKIYMHGLNQEWHSLSNNERNIVRLFILEKNFRSAFALLHELAQNGEFTPQFENSIIFNNHIKPLLDSEQKKQLKVLLTESLVVQFVILCSKCPNLKVQRVTKLLAQSLSQNGNGRIIDTLGSQVWSDMKEVLNDILKPASMWITHPNLVSLLHFAWHIDRYYNLLLKINAPEL